MRAKRSKDHMDTPELLVAAKTVTEQSNMLENDSEKDGFIVFVRVLLQLSWDIGIRYV